LKRKVVSFQSATNYVHSYCRPPVTVPDVMGARAVWRQKSQKKNTSQINFLRTNPTINSHFSDSEPKPQPTFLLTSTLTTATLIPRMPNGIALRFFPCKSLEMRLTPFLTALTSLHLPNQQSKALCSTYDDSIFGHGQPTQTLKK